MTQFELDKHEIAEVERIKGRIADLVNRRFANGASTYYLSQLGNDLGSDRPLVERISRRKLAQFIKDEFNFTIEITGQHRNILQIMRDGAATPVSAVPPRYNRSFWAAFVIPLKEGERRFLNLGTLTFGPDKASVEAAGGEIREITADYVAQPETSGSPQCIAEQVQRWLTDQGLDPAPFLDQKRHAVRHARQSALDVLLEALDGDQLRRVHLPLDIVQALNARPVR